MTRNMTRRRFSARVAERALGMTLVAGSLPTGRVQAAIEPAGGEALTFPVLGDLHFDRLEDHDLEWLRRDHPGDVSQVENYSRLTREVMPRLFDELRQINAGQGRPFPFVLQVGDLVEGLCGDAERAAIQCAGLDRPGAASGPRVAVLVHEGEPRHHRPGAEAAFERVLMPFLREQTGQDLRSSSYTVERGGALFVFVDAYDRQVLDWLERTLAARTARHVFVVIHPPVVPFGARSLWHLYANPKQEPQRRRLLHLLGEHRAIVVCGHLHKFGVVVRATQRGPFLQLAISSIISRPDIPATQPRVGIADYGPDLVVLEPKFSPETEPQRREALCGSRHRRSAATNTPMPRVMP